MDDRAEREHALTAAAGGDDRALFALADRWQEAWRLDDAQSLVLAALPMPIDHAHAHFRLSILAMHQGFAGEAFAHADEALQLAPRNRVIWDHALTLEKLHEAQSPARFLNRHRLFGAQFAADEANSHVRVARTLDPWRTLRVAYLSPDAHLAMARFTDCLMTQHDPAQIEASFYYAFDVDLREVQTRFPRARHVSLAGSSADHVVERLLGDRIDIAIHLAGHGAGNQLAVLQRRPAPVQITWLDYVATTGVPAVDWRICDAVIDPPGNERWSTEMPLRLEVSPWCYTPFPQAPALRAASLGAGLVIGVPCIPLKLSERTLALARRVLEALPRARLLLLGVSEGRAQQRVRSAFAGVDPARIELQPRLTLTEYYGAIDRMDIVLDPVPFSGATATLDCLWQGIPVVTLPGELPHSRSSASIVSQLGLDGWIARDASHFVEIVAQLAGDRATRERLRASLRTRLLASSLVDGRQFMNTLEAALRRVWTHYARSQDLATPLQQTGVGDNYRAERNVREASRANERGAAAPVREHLDEALRQLPGWPEVRQRYWALVQDAALRQLPPRADSAQLPVAATLLSASPEAQAILAALPWLSDSRGITVAAGQSLHAIYRALSRDGADEAWLLLGDAQARSLWSSWPVDLSAAMADAEAVAALGEIDAAAPQLHGARLIQRDKSLAGQVWPSTRNHAACLALCSPWLLIRRDALRTAIDSVPAEPESLGGGASLRLARWHRTLTRQLATKGARLAIASGMLCIEPELAADPHAVEGWLFTGIAQYEAADRHRIDVGRGFAVRDAHSAGLLIRELFDAPRQNPIVSGL